MPALGAAELRQYAVRRRERTIVVTALAVSSVVAVLMALGFWVFFVHALSDPVGPGHGPSYGVSEVFDIAEVRGAVVPPGSYGTRGGVRTAEQLNGIPDCGNSGSP
ncbi:MULTISPECIES: hypothetical protein [Streptomyces]|uniref:hypothetical protein n=1 Tax=Streptomyces TaxID=1883 RepID=UPI000D507897|nr:MULTISPECIES: hypothetical protein [Streptomyces]PVC70186.1 hypothetical protein DBP15_13860 [Streptomyces sp. CS065A]